jgi:hypothetical protein
MSSPFQPLKAQATTGRPVRGLTTMPAIGAVEPVPQMPKVAAAPHPSMSGSGAGKGFGVPTANKMEGAFTHETRGGTAPVAATQGVNSHNTIPHISMHPSKGMTP